MDDLFTSGVPRDEGGVHELQPRAPRLSPSVVHSIFHRPVSDGRRDLDGGSQRIDALKYAAKRALALLLVANFLGYATIGPNGVLRLSGYHTQKNERIGELAGLAAEQAKLVHHIELLNPDSADPDFVDEMLRTQLGLVRPDEVIIMLP